MHANSPAAGRPASDAAPPDGKATIFGLQGLRFWAAAMVVVTHVLNREVNLYHPYPLPRAPWMESGVDIFFVISGFIMVHILRSDTRPGLFWLQRFTRIAPLYWIATLVAFLGGLVLPDWFFGRQSPGFALQSALFMPTGHDSNAHPLISPGWTLVYEFAFYTILSLCLAVRRPPFGAAVLVVALVVAIGPLLAGSIPWLGYYSDQALMLEFLFGMAVAVLSRQGALQPLQGAALAIAGMVLIYLLWDFQLDWPRGVKIGPAGLPSGFGDPRQRAAVARQPPVAGRSAAGRCVLLDLHRALFLRDGDLDPVQPEPMGTRHGGPVGLHCGGRRCRYRLGAAGASAGRKAAAPGRCAAGFRGTRGRPKTGRRQRPEVAGARVLAPVSSTV